MPSLLTTAQLAQSDRLVLHALRERKIPVAWDLAGGYQKPISKVMPSMKIRLERVLRRGSDHSFISTSKNNL